MTAMKNPSSWFYSYYVVVKMSRVVSYWPKICNTFIQQWLITCIKSHSKDIYKKTAILNFPFIKKIWFLPKYEAAQLFLKH